MKLFLMMSMLRGRRGRSICAYVFLCVLDRNRYTVQRVRERLRVLKHAQIISKYKSLNTASVLQMKRKSTGGISLTVLATLNVYLCLAKKVAAVAHIIILFAQLSINILVLGHTR